MKEINENIGKNLKRMRKRRELTIDELSTISTVSKSMISEIERGIRNPSITILWSLANALKKPLNYFLKEEETSEPVVYRINPERIANETGMSIRSMMDFDPDKKFEIYFNDYHPHSSTEPSFHFDGVEEYAMVSRGTLTVVVDGMSHAVGEGEVIHFSADKLHHYANETDQVVQAFVLIFYTD